MLVCGLALPACGGSPTPPSSTTLNLVGTWTGTWTFVTAGATVSDTVTMTVAQIPSGESVGGQWSAAGGAAGTVSFPPTAEITGTLTISQTLVTGGNCSASTTLTGTASTNQIRFTLGTLTPTGLCQWATNQQFTFSR
jgi:hypothetical protein